MEKQTFLVPNISCEHCVNAIQSELTELDGVAHVAGDPGKKSIEVEWDSPATLETIKQVLQEIDYPASE